MQQQLLPPRVRPLEVGSRARRRGATPARWLARIAVLALSMALWTTGVRAQQRRITGVVRAEGTGEGLAGAGIVVQGTTTGTIAGDDGRFALNVSSRAVTLLVRRIGFKQKVVPVAADQNEITISLAQDVLQLEEQVVTGQATSVARANLANDVATVSSQELTRVATPTLENALQGKIAGATISQNSGAPGGGMQVRMRGVTSINGSSSPLYVVDGVIINNMTINPGTNAVSGASSGLNASSQDNGVNRIADLNPEDIENVEVLKGSSASAIYGSEAANGVIIITTKRGTAGATHFRLTQRLGTAQRSNSIGSRRFTLDSAITFAAKYGVSADTVRQWFQATGGYNAFEDQVFGEHPLSYETDLSASGGSASTTFFASGLLKHDGGIMANTGYDKQSLRLNVQHLFGPRVTVNLNTNLVHSLTDRGLTGNDNNNNSPYNVFAQTPSFFDFRPRNGVYPTNPFTSANPLQTIALMRNPEEVFRLIGGVNARYEVLTTDRQSLTATLDAGIDQFNQQDHLYSPPELQFEPRDGFAGTATQQSGTAVVGTYAFSLAHRFTPSTHAYTATTSIGYRGGYQSSNTYDVVTRDLLAGQENIDRGSSTTIFQLRQKTFNSSFFGQEELLTLNERLLVTLGVLGERSTNDGDISHFYMYPKTAASYRVPGMPHWMDELKVRVAYGQTGNQPLYGMKFTPYTGAVYGGINYVQPGGTLGSPDIKPERQTEIEGGIDAGLFGSRVSVSATVYQKRITDLILRPTVAPSTGASSEYINGGAMRNRGVEIGLTGIPVRTSHLEWTSRVTFARNVGLVEELPVPAFVVSGFGYSYGQGRIEVGKSPTQIVGWAPADVGCPEFCGTLRYGDTEPDFTMGFSNEITWRKLRIYGLLDWRHGGDNVNATMRKYDLLALAPDYPASVERQHAWRDSLQGVYIQDASFVKLREISLSYPLPGAFTRRLFGGLANTVRVEATGRNLYTWTKYRGLDPEVSNFGNQNILRNQDLYPYPPSRTFFFSLGVDF